MSTTMSNRDVQIDEAVTTAADRLWPKAVAGIDADTETAARSASRELFREHRILVSTDRLEREISGRLYDWVSHGR